MKSILILFHCQSDAGYAIDALLPVFLNMAVSLVGDRSRVHVSFAQLNRDRPDPRLAGVKSVIEYDPATRDKAQNRSIEAFIRDNDIDTVFGFDQPVHQPAYRYIRRGGVKTFVSYWGASMSSLNRGLKLMLKRIEVALWPASPDHYIFESQAMADTAIFGRGVPEKNTSIVRLGVDSDRYRPDQTHSRYAHGQFSIPTERKIIYYSGHMEPRKGVRVLMLAAAYLYHELKRRDFHLLLLGNQPGQEEEYLAMLQDGAEKDHVTFAGYRSDVDKILPGCYLGSIASTGWDSFTMSSLEIASCGLPLVVSGLQGLKETIEDQVTGFQFPPGDHARLAQHIARLLDDERLRDRMGSLGRERVLARFSRERQVEALADIVRRVAGAGTVR